METENLITDPESDGVAPATTTTEPIPQGGMPSEGTSDADKKALDETVKKFQNDLNSMKSTFQKSEAQLKREMAEQKKLYETQLRELKVSKMDEEQRKQFEAQELVERNRNFEAEALAAKQALVEREQKDQYRDFFIAKGIDPKDLVNDQGLEALVNSGYAAWDKVTTSLKAKLAKLEKAKEGDGEIDPPEVDTETGKKPAKGSNWPDLIKKYGSEEAVWRMIDRGVLPASILPQV